MHLYDGIQSNSNGREPILSNNFLRAQNQTTLITLNNSLAKSMASSNQELLRVGLALISFDP